MFSTKTAVTTNGGGTYMPAGINENVTLKEVNVQKSPTGRDYLEVIFQDEAGQIATMTEWKNEKSQFIKTDEDLQRRDNLQFGRILQILHCYIEDIPDTELNTFKDMIDWVKSTLDGIQDKDKTLLRLKVIFDKNNYTKVSSYGVFVEPMTVEKKDSQIKKLGRDNFERTIVADTETTDPLASNSTPETEKTGADDLPF